MKKMVLGFSMVLAALVFLGSPALAATESSTLSAADLAFLASLAAPAPTLAAKRPASLEKALCSAQATCWDGSVISCLGNNSTTSCSATDSNCSAGQQGSVTCDGNTTACPPCPGCGPDFCTWEDEQNCSNNCYPCSYTLTCNTTYCAEICRCNFRTCPQ
jgi:hypothetical protein